MIRGLYFIYESLSDTDKASDLQAVNGSEHLCLKGLLKVLTKYPFYGRGSNPVARQAHKPIGNRVTYTAY